MAAIAEHRRQYETSRRWRVAASAQKATRLARVEGREGAPRWLHGVDPGDEERRRQGGHELHRHEQAGGRDRAAGELEDDDRERDLAEPVAELVREVGARRGA